MRQQFKAATNAYLDAGHRLVQVLPGFRSMDDALYYLSHDEKCISLGKIAIANTLLKAERSSHLTDNGQGRPDVEACDKTWACEFLRMAVSPLKRSDVAAIFDNVTVINFNYDRAFEYYLYWALQSYYGLSPAESGAVVSKLKVIRPYGSLGPLDWNRHGKPFGSQANNSLFEWANGIRTFTEQYASDLPEKIDQALNEAGVILLLGFGFHEQNVKLLRPIQNRKGDGGRRFVFATMKGIAEDNKRLLLEELEFCFNTERVPLKGCKAADMLAELAPSIRAVAGQS